LGEYGEAMVDGTKVKVWIQIVMFEHTLYKAPASLLCDCGIVMDIMIAWGTLSLTSIVKHKFCKFTLLSVLIGQTKQEPIEFAELTQIANYKQY
jgi:hypothetical protein